MGPAYGILNPADTGEVVATAIFANLAVAALPTEGNSRHCRAFDDREWQAVDSSRDQIDGYSIGWKQKSPLQLHLTVLVPTCRIEAASCELEEADSAEVEVASPRIERLTERLASLRGRLGELEEIGRQLEAATDGQISLTDPDARAMATGSDHRGVVGYNVQAVVDIKHRIVVAIVVTQRGYDRSHLLEMAKAATGTPEMIALADRGYYEGEQIRACATAGVTPMVPRPNTSPA